MAQEVVDVGTFGNDNTGDYLRPAFIKINTNFTELYEALDNDFADIAFSGDWSDVNNKPSLGTAAAKNVGITEGSVVEVGADGKLPALDGSLLTNIVGGGGGGGDIDVSGTPTAEQTMVWVDSNTAKGVTTLSGGTSGQVLTKINGTDYNYAWASGAATIDVSGTPTTNQLARWTDENTLQGVSTITMSYISNAGTFATANIVDYNFVPDGGTTGQVLAKNSVSDGDTEWITILTEVVQDTSPQLGANLDLNGFTVGAATAADLIKLNALTATAVELNYVDGVTSAIQSQLDNKSGVTSGATAPISAPGAVGDIYIDEIAEAVYVGVNTASTADFLRLISGSADVVEILEDLSAEDSVALIEEMGGLTEDDIETVVLATHTQISAGTAGDLFMTPEPFMDSRYGIKEICVPVFDSDEDVTVGDGVKMVGIPSSFNGLNIVGVRAYVYTQGVTGSTDVQVRRRRSGSNVDVLSTKVTIGAEYSAADGVINTSNDDLATGDVLLIDVDAVQTTEPLGLTVTIECSL
jgi:hypothetical protein